MDTPPQLGAGPPGAGPPTGPPLAPPASGPPAFAPLPAYAPVGPPPTGPAAFSPGPGAAVPVDPAAAGAPTADARGLIPGTLILLGGLVMAVAPLAAWFTFGFGPLEASINGYGSISAGGFDQPSDDSGFTVTTDTSSDGDVDWILGSLADGYVSTVLGILVAGTGALIVARSLGSARAGDLAALAARRRGAMALSGLTLGLVAVALVWVIVSYTRLKSDFDSQLSDVGDDPFAGAFLSGLHFGPGVGMILEGLAIVGVGIVAVVALLLTATGIRLRAEGVSVPSAPTTAAGASWAPPPQAPGAGQPWSSPSGAPAPPPTTWGPPPGAPAPPPPPEWASDPAPPAGAPGSWPPSPGGPPTAPG